MSNPARTSNYRFVAISYSIGLSLIFSASVLNLCLHKLPPKHLYSLPSWLVSPYEQAGPIGVTLFVAGLGFLLVLLGVLGTFVSGSSSRSGRTATLDSSGELNYSNPGISTPTEVSCPGGMMALETFKYMGKKPSALPGSTVIVHE